MNRKLEAHSTEGANVIPYRRLVFGLMNTAVPWRILERYLHGTYCEKAGGGGALIRAHRSILIAAHGASARLHNSRRFASGRPAHSEKNIRCYWFSNTYLFQQIADGSFLGRILNRLTMKKFSHNSTAPSQRARDSLRARAGSERERTMPPHTLKTLAALVAALGIHGAALAQTALAPESGGGFQIDDYYSHMDHQYAQFTKIVVASAHARMHHRYISIDHSPRYGALLEKSAGIHIAP